MDVAVSGLKFGASSVPSLKQFIRDIAKTVPSPQGGTVYDLWKKAGQPEVRPQETSTSTYRPPAAQVRGDAPVGDLGSGSDYQCFYSIWECCDISSTGDYGVYHSVFDNFAWFEIRRSRFSLRAADVPCLWPGDDSHGRR
jgi:N-acetylated-alpha-linked acidic dipeptidase